jgi:hypothetical protein
MSKVLALCAVLLFGFTSPARAEWQFTPMAGFTMFGNTSLIDLENGSSERHRHLGLSLALLGKGILGAEVVTLWTPGFFEKSNAPVEFVESSRTVVAMGNIVLTAPRRWTEYSLRPFVSGGLGLMHASVREILPGGGIFPIGVNVAGFNIGGGAVGFLSERTGLRFDFRYHSTLNRSENAPSIGPVHLRYVTASIGLVFRR